MTRRRPGERSRSSVSRSASRRRKPDRSPRIGDVPENGDHLRVSRPRIGRRSLRRASRGSPLDDRPPRGRRSSVSHLTLPPFDPSGRRVLVQISIGRSGRPRPRMAAGKYRRRRTGGCVYSHPRHSPAVMSLTGPCPPTNSSRKSTLFCPQCEHASRLDGDWDVRETARSLLIRCPDCRTTIAARPRSRRRLVP